MTAPRRLDAAWLSDGVVPRLLAVLSADGEEARVVGGAVRNALLGVPVADIDIATTCIPDDVMRRVTKAGFKAVPTGIAHGTITVVIDGCPFEVTTLRQDVETFGRHATVAFGRDWQVDAQRRDFTMNALSVSSEGTIHDYVGGLQDLAEHRVRFIGDPHRRVAEDYLRILRFFRFHAAYGEGHVDRAGLHACVLARRGLDQLSRERVRAELFKLVVARHAVAALVDMAETGLLTDVLAGVPLLASFANMVKVEHEIGALPDPMRRIGALSLYTHDDVERLSQRLRLSNAEQAQSNGMSERWWRIKVSTGPAAARALLYRLGPQAYRDRVLLAWARSPETAHDRTWHDLAQLPQHWVAPIAPFKAADFIQRGVARGPKLGAALHAAELAWIEADFPSDPSTIDTMVTEAVQRLAM